MWVNGHLAARKTGFNWVGAYNAYGIGHDWRLEKFVKTNGYVSVALEGLCVAT